MLRPSTADRPQIEQGRSAPPLRYLSVRFGCHLAARDLGAFRGALVNHVGRDFDRLHNHGPGHDNYLYRYPLIQYRVAGGQAALFCIGQGAEDIRAVLDGPLPELWINGRRVVLRVEDVNIDYYAPKVGTTMLHYELRDYLPLSQDNERTWARMDDYARGDFLRRLLTGHMLAYARGVDWEVREQLRIELKAVRVLRPIRYKGIARPAFDVRFRSNAELPAGIGLGKAVAMGFGVLYTRRPDKREDRR